jgi:hypothetical protein
MNDLSILERALEYARLSGITLDLKTPLGNGTDGTVWKTSRKTAVKSLGRQPNYERELTCYQRFKEKGITKLQGFSVPQLVNSDDDLLIIEMGIVSAPYILDFAKCWIDRPADYSAETMAEWDEEGEERFEGRWPQVKSLLSSLKRFGIYYYDAKPANIRFEDEIA